MGGVFLDWKVGGRDILVKTQRRTKGKSRVWGQVNTYQLTGLGPGLVNLAGGQNGILEGSLSSRFLKRGAKRAKQGLWLFTLCPGRPSQLVHFLEECCWRPLKDHLDRFLTDRFNLPCGIHVSRVQNNFHKSSGALEVISQKQVINGW